MHPYAFRRFLQLIQLPHPLQNPRPQHHWTHPLHPFPIGHFLPSEYLQWRTAKHTVLDMPLHPCLRSVVGVISDKLREVEERIFQLFMLELKAEEEGGPGFQDRWCDRIRVGQGWRCGWGADEGVERAAEELEIGVWRGEVRWVEVGVFCACGKVKFAHGGYVAWWGVGLVVVVGVEWTGELVAGRSLCGAVLACLGWCRSD